MLSFTIIFSFLIAFAVAFATTPFVKELAKKVGAVDNPGEARRVHKTPIPLLGGLAIFYGFVVSLLCLCDIDMSVRGMILGSLVIVITGIFDDIYSLHPLVKLAGQVVAAIIIVLHGIIIYRISMPTVIAPSGVVELGYLAVPITVIWIVAVTNAVKPVLPPSATPAPLSTKVVTVLVPSIEPVIVAILSEYIILS